MILLLTREEHLVLDLFLEAGMSELAVITQMFSLFRLQVVETTELVDITKTICCGGIAA